MSHNFFGAFTMASIFVMFLGLLSLFEYIKSLYRNEAIMRRLQAIQARQNNNGAENNDNNNDNNNNANQQAEDNLEQELIDEAAAAEEQEGNQDEAMGFDELRKFQLILFPFKF